MKCHIELRETRRWSLAHQVVLLLGIAHIELGLTGAAQRHLSASAYSTSCLQASTRAAHAFGCIEG